MKKIWTGCNKTGDNILITDSSQLLKSTHNGQMGNITVYPNPFCPFVIHYWNRVEWVATDKLSRVILKKNKS